MQNLLSNICGQGFERDKHSPRTLDWGESEWKLDKPTIADAKRFIEQTAACFSTP